MHAARNWRAAKWEQRVTATGVPFAQDAIGKRLIATAVNDMLQAGFDKTPIACAAQSTAADRLGVGAFDAGFELLRARLLPMARGSTCAP